MTLINPAEFPIRSSDLKLDLLTGAATDLRTWGDSVYTTASSASTAWLGLSTSYVGPDSERAYALMNEPTGKATDVLFHAHRAARILDDTETELKVLKGRLLAIELLATLFRNNALNGVVVPIGDGDGPLGGVFSLVTQQEKTITWQEHGPSVRRNASLLADYEAWETDYNALMAEKATALCQIPEVQIPLALPVVAPMPNLTSLDPGGDQPWGVPNAERRTLFEGLQHSTGKFLDETLTVALAAVGFNRYDALSNVSAEGRGKNLVNFYGNAFDSLGSLLLFKAAQPFQAMRDAGSTNPITLWMAQRGDVGKNVGYALMGLDPASADPTHQWSQDPWGTGAFTLLGVLSLPRGGPLGLLSRVSRLNPNLPSARLLTPTGTHTPFGNIPGVRPVTALPPRLNIDRRAATRLLGGPDAPNTPRPSQPRTAPGQRTDPTVPPRMPVDEVNASPATISRIPDSESPGAARLDENGQPLERSGNSAPVAHHPADSGPLPEDAGSVDRAPTPPVTEGVKVSPPPPALVRGSDGHLHEVWVSKETSSRTTESQVDTESKPSTADRAEALRNAPVDGNGTLVDHRSGQPLRGVDGQDGSWYARWETHDSNGTPTGRWIAENPGAAGLTQSVDNLPLKGAPNTYGYDANGDLRPYANHRPSHHDNDVATVWTDSRNAQVDAIDAGDLDLPKPGEDQMWVRVRDDAEFEGESLVTLTDDLGFSSKYRLIEWRPGESRNGLWDMGHKPDAKYDTNFKLYMSGKLSLRRFLEDYRTTDNYLVQDPGRNRGHYDE